MAQEIRNTLFRLTTLRAPELNKENNFEKRFVFRNSNVPLGIFDLNMQNKSEIQTKWDVLRETATQFENTSEAVLSIESLKSNSLYPLSIWILENKTKFNESNLLNAVEGLTFLTNTEEAVLWNNLFYQVITQKDFYAKEIIIQLLIANNLLNYLDTSKPKINFDLLKAVVVLPKILFKEDVSNVNLDTNKIANENIKPGNYISKELSSFSKVTGAKIANEFFEKLKKEIVKVEKKYTTSYNKAYNLAKTNHDSIIKPIIEQYNIDLETSRKAFAQFKPLELKYDPADPSHQIDKIEFPEFPEFNFEFHSPFDKIFLQNNLSIESFNTLSYIASLHFSNEINSENKIVINEDLISEFETYEYLNNQIEIQIEQNNQIISDNEIVDQSELVSLGGMLVPIENTNQMNSFQYQTAAVPIFNNIFRVNFIFGLPDNTWDMEFFNYTFVKTSGNFSKTIIDHKKIDKTIYIEKIETGIIDINNLLDIQEFKGEIGFKNGCKKTFSIPNFKLYLSYTNTLLGECNLTLPSNTVITNDQKPFIPSGFGVKQIGIADYKKVEQSTLCYVEGDVAHIENIMAREYREKATRRLRKSEVTETTSSETENEQLTDTTSANRFEMQSEVAKVIQNSKDINVNANVSYQPTPQLNISAGAGFASHNSKEESTRQAVNISKEITERALERVVTKVKNERIEKIIEEFEENNKHGFDNTKGDKHVVGVYRWVDKLYKNQIYNYGKRLMFEFMIPEPSKLHTYGMQAIKNNLPVLKEPKDPRMLLDTDSKNLSDFSKINDITLKYWTGIYKVDFSPKPKSKIFISKGFEGNYNSTGYYTTGKGEIEIPEGYEVHKAKASLSFDFHPTAMEGSGVSINIGQKYFNRQWYYHFNFDEVVFNDLGGIQNSLAVAYKAFDCGTFSMSVVAECTLTNEAYIKWQIDTFNAIIDAYEEALEKYKQQLAEQQALGVQIKGTNPGFYRQIENTILKKNCVSYIINQDTNAYLTYGKNKLTRNTTFNDYEVNVTKELDDYAAFVKFIEQAFEWDIMSYNFYPYYWGNRNNWTTLYQYDDTIDPLFKSFMQAGMARVVVTVRPGFEDAVRYYFQTGQIWNGGEVPVIEDELFLSIVDELKAPIGIPEGKAWITRMPLPLTILQADSIGLKVEKALPCYCENVTEDTFEDPTLVPCNEGESNFEITTDKLGGEIISEVITDVTKF